MKLSIAPIALNASHDQLGAPVRPNGPPLAPLLAGARARGVADGLEWLGLAAVMLDDRGEVLHVNAGAIELMGEDIYLEAGRLRARDDFLNGELNQAIFEAKATGAPSRVDSSIGQGGVSLRVAPFAAQDDDPYQLLRVVVILERQDRAASRH